MFRGLGTWLGLENPTYTKSSDDKDVDYHLVLLFHHLRVLLHLARTLCIFVHVLGFSVLISPQYDAVVDSPLSPEDYIFSFASSATKKKSLRHRLWAQTIKKSVEEGKIDGIIDKTFLGDFQKEQEKFVQEKKAKRSEAAVPPWVGYNEEETIQQQILALSAVRDRRHYDLLLVEELAYAKLDQAKQLVSSNIFVKEEVFWRNYFYRVSLIKQSAQLTALAAQQQQQDSGDSVSPEDVILTDNVRPKTPPVSINDLQKPPQEEEEEMSTSPGVSEFVSDAFDSTAINQEDLRKEMEQLVLDKKDSTPSPDDESADWEKELQQELQEYEVVTETDNKDDQWDQEIEKMLQADDS
uniref:Synapse associated protein 1 n=1 Tax=Acanthochromis polyacanthus TaxID=80966 RepID=A0A3Q1G7B6_9TELE